MWLAEVEKAGRIRPQYRFFSLSQNHAAHEGHAQPPVWERDPKTQGLPAFLAATAARAQGVAPEAIEHLRDSDQAVCGELTDVYLKQLFKNKSNCETAAKGSKAKNSFDIKSVKVNGDQATVGIQSKQRKGTVVLVKTGGDWKISQIKVG